MLLYNLLDRLHSEALQVKLQVFFCWALRPLCSSVQLEPVGGSLLAQPVIVLAHGLHANQDQTKRNIGEVSNIGRLDQQPLTHFALKLITSRSGHDVIATWLGT
jgi:hypothetical protein